MLELKQLVDEFISKTIDKKEISRSAVAKYAKIEMVEGYWEIYRNLT